jgi:hypothetical protein
MGLPTPHSYAIIHPPGVIAEIWVNDVLFYRRASTTYQAPRGPFNHLMLEGENQVVLRIAERESIPFRISTFDFAVQRDTDDAKIFHRRWPELAELHPEEERKLPIQHEASFVFAESTPKPIWADAPVQHFPIEGTEAQHEALRELHDAFARADTDAFLDSLELKNAEFIKFYGPMPELERSTAKRSYDATFAEGWELDPFDPKEIVFERCAGGRAAYASRRDGRPALFARSKANPGDTWEANLLLSKVDGRWRVIW